MELLYAVSVVIETIILTLAYYGLSRKNLAFNISTSLAISMAGSIMTFSFILQLLFLIGVLNALFAIEIFILVFSFLTIVKNSKFYVEDFRNVFQNYELRFALILFLVPIVYLLLQSVVLRPNNADSLVYNLARCLLYEDAGTLFPKSVSDYAHVTLPLGNDILYHLFLRFEGEKGLAYFSFFAYVGSILAIYSLVRIYHSIKTSFCSALVFACLPEMVFHATTPKNDLAVVFFALCSLIAFLHFSRHKSHPNIALFLLFVAGGLSCKSTFLAFAIPIIFGFLFWALRKNNLSVCLELLKSRLRIGLALVFIFVIMSQVWLFVYNAWAWGTWSGPPFFVNGNVNQDGVLGGVANLCRYFFESLHLTSTVDFAWEKFFGFSLSASLLELYNQLFYPIFGDIALAQPFSINWSQTEDTWYGPIGFATAWIGAPSALYFRKSPAKWVAVLSFSFLFILAYKINWWSSNQRYLACFFALTVVASAPLLEKIHEYKLLIIPIYIVSILIGLHALLFNVTKPTFHFLSPRIDLMLKDSFINGTNVWTQTRFGKEAWWPLSLGNWNKLNLKNKTVGIVASNHHNHFNFIMAHPDARFVGLAHNRRLPQDSYERIFSNQELNLSGIDFLLLLSVDHSIDSSSASNSLSIFTPAENTLKKILITPKNYTLSLNWRHQPDESKPAYVLYRVVKKIDDS